MRTRECWRKNPVVRVPSFNTISRVALLAAVNLLAVAGPPISDAEVAPQCPILNIISELPKELSLDTASKLSVSGICPQRSPRGLPPNYLRYSLERK